MPLTRKEFLDIAGSGAVGAVGRSAFGSSGSAEPMATREGEGSFKAGERPFSYMATAVVFGGQMTEPHADLLDVQGATVLPPSGGHGSARVANYRYGQIDKRRYVQIVSIGSANSEVFGSQKDGSYETLTTVTVEDLSIADDRVKAGLIVAQLISIRTPGTKEPPFRHTTSTIKGLYIDDQEIVLDPDQKLDNDDCSRFTAAVKHYDEIVHPKTVKLGLGPTQALIASRKDGDPFPDVMLQMSIFEKAKLKDGAKLKLGAKPGQCSIEADGLRVSLGELEITSQSRRLTMLRVTLGPNLGGELVAASVEGDGRDP